MQTEPMPTTKEKPIHEVRIGAIEAAIWRNELHGGGVRYNATFCRVYKDRDGERWKFTDSFGRGDLLTLGKVVDATHTWICQQIQEKDTRSPG